MVHPDEVKWNARYSSEDYRHMSARPHGLLTGFADVLPPAGLALDVACGTSSSGLYLAGRNWRVIGLDIAEAALRMAQGRGRQAGLAISFAIMDLADPWLPESHFDAILDFYYLSRPLWATYKKAIKPGGWLFFETYLWQPDVERHPEFYLQPDELRQAFAGWEVRHYQELDRPRGELPARRIAQLVARKPG